MSSMSYWHHSKAQIHTFSLHASTPWIGVRCNELAEPELNARRSLVASHCPTLAALILVGAGLGRGAEHHPSAPCWISSPFPGRVPTVAPAPAGSVGRNHLPLGSASGSSLFEGGQDFGPGVSAQPLGTGMGQTSQLHQPQPPKHPSISVLWPVSGSRGYFCCAFPPAAVRGWAQAQFDQIELPPLSPRSAEVKWCLVEMDWRDSHSLSCFTEYITSLDLLSRKSNELTVSGWPSGRWITIL